MTAIRVIDNHSELENSGQVSHGTLDDYALNARWIIESGSAVIPPNARKLTAGAGVIITDYGPGGNLTVGIDPNYSPPGKSIFWNEIPLGNNDGINTTFSFISSSYPTSAMMFFVNGVLQKQGATCDYILSGNIVTLNYAPRSGSNLSATYPW